MAFTAVHDERGRLDATQEDLGCGWAWAGVHRARPRAPLSCPVCGYGVHAKVSSRGLRFFAHDTGAPACALAQESVEHHLLKLELASSVRAAGWYAELEVGGPGGAWRADVMSVSRDGEHRMAWEAQLSPITPDEIALRTSRFAADGVRVCWVGIHRRPWLGTVPSVLAAPPRENGARWTVADGLARFLSNKWSPATAALEEFVGWALAGRIVGHRFARPQHLADGMCWPGAWTAPHYIEVAARWQAQQRRLEEESAAARARQFRPGTGWRGTGYSGRLRPPDAARIAARSWRLSVPAERRHRIREAAAAWVSARHGVPPYFGHEDFDPQWGGGIPLCAGGPDAPVLALLRPKPALVRWEYLEGITVLAAGPADHARLVAHAPDTVTVVDLSVP
ncbi:competence protein CoiA [Kitasatospora aureofaciens]|uniref:competence protein CoiA n=1 Tax=Kitasatospora aureofaciens TaxID=1894 RepID=UPI0037CA2908